MIEELQLTFGRTFLVQLGPSPACFGRRRGERPRVPGTLDPPEGKSNRGAAVTFDRSFLRQLVHHRRVSDEGSSDGEPRAPGQAGGAAGYRQERSAQGSAALCLVLHSWSSRISAAGHRRERPIGELQLTAGHTFLEQSVHHRRVRRAAAPATSARTRGISCRPSAGTTDRGAAADVWPCIPGATGASPSCSGRGQRRRRTSASARTRGSRRRLPVGKGRSGSSNQRLTVHSWSSRCIIGVRTKAAEPAAATSTRTRGIIQSTRPKLGKKKEGFRLPFFLQYLRRWNCSCFVHCGLIRRLFQR